MIENNQSNSKRGGARKNAGRKAGAATTKTREIADKAMAEGISPLEYMLQVMRNSGDERMLFDFNCLESLREASKNIPESF